MLLGHLLKYWKASKGPEDTQKSTYTWLSCNISVAALTFVLQKSIVKFSATAVLLQMEVAVVMSTGA